MKNEESGVDVDQQRKGVPVQTIFKIVYDAPVASHLESSSGISIRISAAVSCMRIPLWLPTRSKVKEE